ncbi:hypothetical protein BD311DRAFT_512015 [Dichomitus squalens]|uniref:Uncharacterized protein n=1 Tax=Dichomitus squalens TaxID=114155 RepID=A0A4Q9N132_9APHY|nr:hypothetical protein BD311DRAFT_512015 [Dichomitus squalens]
MVSANLRLVPVDVHHTITIVQIRERDAFWRRRKRDRMLREYTCCCAVLCAVALTGTCRTRTFVWRGYSLWRTSFFPSAISRCSVLGSLLHEAKCAVGSRVLGRQVRDQVRQAAARIPGGRRCGLVRRHVYLSRLHTGAAASAMRNSSYWMYYSTSVGHYRYRRLPSFFRPFHPSHMSQV